MGSYENERTKIPQKLQVMYQEAPWFLHGVGQVSPLFFPGVQCSTQPGSYLWGVFYWWPDSVLLIILLGEWDWTGQLQRSLASNSVILFSVSLTKFGPLRSWRCLKAGSIQHSIKLKFQKKAFRHCHFGSSGKSGLFQQRFLNNLL